MRQVEVVHWNPRRAPANGGFRVPTRANNFGDLLGPVIVRRLLGMHGLGPPAGRGRRLLTVGSIMRLSRSGDVIWGTGVNGKSENVDYSDRRLDVRAVRGPLTRDVLIRNGHRVPDVFGDPGLLVGSLWSRDAVAGARPRTDLLVVPNINEVSLFAAGPDVVDPRLPLWEVLGRIAASGFVVGSSLHAIVVAESWGIPARLVHPRVEPLFKYEDYYLGSGRNSFAPAGSIAEAVAQGGEPGPRWDPEPLMAAFPTDLWSAAKPQRVLPATMSAVRRLARSGAQMRWK
ncbi:polysaccharide pyruvyl transferase family protein [Nakamurella sp. GG22]